MVKLIYSTRDTSGSRLDREALDWIVRLTSGDSTPEDHEAYRAWRDQSADHRKALVEARNLWQRLGHALPTIERQARRNRNWNRLKIGLPIAAVLLLTIGLGQNYWSRWRFDQTTRAGEQRSLTLPDGSRLRMSGDTAIDIRFDGQARRVRIARGQILLSVRHDARVPFVVEAGEASYRDVGTIFDVSHDDGRSHLVVGEGLVQAELGDRRARVPAGYAVSAADSRLGPVTRVDPRRELGWARGRLVFSDRPLRDIVGALAPHYGGRIVMLNGTVGSRRLSASIEIDHIDEWLNALRQTQGVGIRRFAGYTFIL